MLIDLVIQDAHIPIVFAVAGGHSEFIKFWIQLNTLSDATNRKRHVLRRAVLRFNQTSLIPLMGLDDEQDVSKVEGYLCLAMTNCSTQFVHNLLWNLSSFLARTGTPNFTFGRKVVNIDRTKIWSRSFKLDLETFKTLDKFAYLPRVKKEKHLRLLLSSGNKEIFEYLKNRIELSQQWDKCQLLHGAVTGDEPSILEWLTERGITACTMEILNTCLGLALRFNKQRTFSWIVENMQRICPVATQWPLPVNELTLKLVDAMLCVDGTYSYAQMDEFAQKLFGRDIKATLSSNMISISTTTYSLAAVREEPDILQILTDAGKISADDHALMAHAVLHKRFKVVDWLKNNDFPVDWKTMAAVVCTGTYEEIRNMQLNYSKDDLFNWRVTALAARRGDIDILKLLWDFGYPFISSVFLEALTSGSSTCIQWMGKTVPECITISSSFICKCISVVQLTDGTVGTFTRWFLNWLTTFVISKRNHVVDIHEYNHILNLISAEDRTLPRYVTESTCTLYHSNEDPLYQLNQPLNNIMPLNIGMVTKLMERQKWAFHVCGKQAQLIVDNWMKPFLQ